MDLVGLNNVKEQLNKIIASGQVYRGYNIKIPNFLVNLSKSNGQSFVANYITDTLYDNKLQKFTGLDYLLEYRFDGSLRQMKYIFNDIRSNAIYENEFHGVIAIDVTALADYVNEYQVDFFLDKLNDISRYSTIIVFYDSNKKRVDIIKEKILDNIAGKVIEIDFPQYSVEELYQISLKIINNRGMGIEFSEESMKMIQNKMEKETVVNIKQAVGMMEEYIVSNYYENNSNCKIEKGIENNVR